MFSYSDLEQREYFHLIWKQQRRSESELKNHQDSCSALMVSRSGKRKSPRKRRWKGKGEKIIWQVKVKVFWYVWNANNWLSKQHTKPGWRMLWRKWMMSDDDNELTGLCDPTTSVSLIRAALWWHEKSHAFAPSGLTDWWALRAFNPMWEWNKN